MITVNVSPTRNNMPRRGGVKEHLVQLYSQLEKLEKIRIVSDEQADVYHVESSYKSPNDRIDVYVCHGGFVPAVIPQVMRNIRDATVIVTVAKWVAHKYFKQLLYKTVHIPNGIDLEDWNNVPRSGLDPGYVLYAKEWDYHLEPFISAVQLMPKTRFVTTVWPENLLRPDNLTVIGLRTREGIRPYIKDAGCLMLTGDEVCPTMLLEAWAARTPVVAKGNSDSPTGSEELMCISRRLPSCVGGRIFSDPASLVNSVVSVLAGSQELGEQGRQVVELDYQWSNLIEDYVSLYKAIYNNDMEYIRQTALS